MLFVLFTGSTPASRGVARYRLFLISALIVAILGHAWRELYHITSVLDGCRRISIVMTLSLMSRHF